MPPATNRKNTPIALRDSDDLRQQHCEHGSGDLDWIALKALEKQPAKRYRSAAEFAADVSRHLTNDRVLARPSSIRRRVRRFTRRYPLAFRAVAAAAVFVLALGVGAVWRSAMVGAPRRGVLRLGESLRSNGATST